MTAMDDPTITCMAVLERHAAQRRQSTPVVSLLTGSGDTAVETWQRWCERRQVRSIVIQSAEPTAVASALIERLARAYDLPSIALRRLRAVAGICHSASSTVPTIAELEPLVAAAESLDASGSLALAASILRAGNDFERAFILAETFSLLRAFAGLIGDDSTPGVLIVADTPGLRHPEDPGSLAWLRERSGSSEYLRHRRVPVDPALQWLNSISGVLWQLCHAAPTWPIAAACPADAVERYRSTTASSRERSFLLAGVVALAPATVNPMGEGADVPPLPAPLAALVARTISGPAPPALRAAYTTAAALRPRQDDAARSAAERLLYELLQLGPPTRGRFTLNAPAEFQFGSRLAEIDLLAAAIRLAIEVDGYRHFTDADRYRRDRRKDLLLQQHGYFVVRVLADDVLDRPAEILDIIAAAVDHAGRRATRGNL